MGSPRFRRRDVALPWHLQGCSRRRPRTKNTTARRATSSMLAPMNATSTLPQSPSVVFSIRWNNTPSGQGPGQTEQQVADHSVALAADQHRCQPAGRQTDHEPGHQPARIQAERCQQIHGISSLPGVRLRFRACWPANAAPHPPSGQPAFERGGPAGQPAARLVERCHARRHLPSDRPADPQTRGARETSDFSFNHKKSRRGGAPRKVLHHVGLLDDWPPGRNRAALQLVIRPIGLVLGSQGSAVSRNLQHHSTLSGRDSKSCALLCCDSQHNPHPLDEAISRIIERGRRTI